MKRKSKAILFAPKNRKKKVSGTVMESATSAGAIHRGLV
jgi:hypothetical protein